MFGHIARMITILGGGCAVLVAGEIMIGEKSTPLSHDPELRAMQRAPDLASEMSFSSFCVNGNCEQAEIAPDAETTESEDIAEVEERQSADEHLADFVAKAKEAQ